MAPRRRRSSSRGRSPGPPQREHQLPVEAANDMLAGFKGRLHSVKTQDLKLEDGSSITIARVKVPVPKGVSGHLIKRFDTGAISASSLYRVAYPAAKEEEELAEMRFLSKAYDTRGAGAEEADGTGKLTGTWVPVADATTLAKEYGLTKFASELIEFEQTEGQSSNNGAISSPAAPTPRKSKSPAPPPSSASQRSKRARVTSPPAVPATRASTATQSLAPPSPAKPASKRGRGRQSAAAKAAAEQQDDADSVATNDTKDGEVVTSGVQITQEIITDQTTGEVLEETKVTFASADGESNGLIGSNEQAEKAIADAKQLIDSLKQDGVLQSGTSSTKRAREEDDDNAEEEEENDRPGIVSRFFGRKQRSKRRAGEADTLGELQVLQSPDGTQVLVASSPALQPQPNRRRFIAMAGMVVMGAATAAAPYFFN